MLATELQCRSVSNSMGSLPSASGKMTKVLFMTFPRAKGGAGRCIDAGSVFIGAAQCSGQWQRILHPTEMLFAFLDDISVVCVPDRVAAIYAALQNNLWWHARIRANLGKDTVVEQRRSVPRGL